MMEFAPFRLDTVNQCLWRRMDGGADKRLLLPPKAFAVLRYLVKHAGRLVTEAELLEAVWPKTFVQPEAIKSQLYEIRKTLGDNPKAPRYIETLPKRGYQFIAAVRDGSSAHLAASTNPAHAHLVGRDQALSALTSFLRSAADGQHQIVFVTGEPGIGKTALVDEFQHRAATEMPGLRTARGQCVEGYGGKEAYYPMLEALGTLCRGVGGTSIVETLTTQAPTWLVQFPALVKREHRVMLQQEILGATRERMLREIGVALETIATETPLLLVFEDLQWVDHSTVDLLSALARRRTSAKLMLIGTYRPVDLLLSKHPLQALKQDLLVHRLCREIELEPLTEADVGEYLTAESSRVSPPDGLAELIHQHTEGNPLFMVAALDQLTQRGLISRENGNWQIRVPLEEIDLEVPESLRQLIEAQIERLSAEEQRALEAASVVGAAFSARIAATAIDIVPEDFEDLCESLVRQHRIVSSVGAQQFPDGTVFQRYKFVHALYREVLYRRQAPRRRSALHRRIGERLEALFLGQLSDVGSELAYHFEHASDWPRAVKYLQRAADMAEQRRGYREATSLLEHAYTLASNLPAADSATSEIGILKRLAPMYVVTYDSRALNTYEALCAKAANRDLIDVEVSALIEMGELLLWTDSERGFNVLDRAVQLSSRQVDAVARARSRMRCSYLRIWAGNWNNEDSTVCREALSEIRQARDSLVHGPYLIDYSNILYMCSEYRESQRIALEGVAAMTAESKGNPCANLPQAVGAWIGYCDLLFLGEWGDALSEIESAIAALIKNGNDGFVRPMRLWRAWLNVFAMDFAGGLEICESAARLFDNATPPPNRRFYMALAGTAEVALGNQERALEHLLPARLEMDRQALTNDWLCRVLLESALTDLWLAKGDLSQARAQGNRFLEAALATAERTWQALAWEANARIAMAQGDATRAQECVARALSTTVGFEVPLAAWRVHAAATELYTLAGDKKSAKRHRELSGATIFKLADSLPADHPLRKTFLSTPAVCKILSDT